jgi:hypothetical protein
LRDIIPAPVFEAIQTRLKTVGDNANDAWLAANADEDTLTGDFCGRLATRRPHRIWINRNEQWEWVIRYKKFRGRGKGAFERKSGADGIIVVEVTTNGEKVYKSLLFQAKKGDLRVDADLTQQVRKMERLSKGSSAVFEYREGGYRAVPGGVFLERGSAPDRRGRIQANENPLGTFLGDEFLPCGIGLRGMYYDAVREILVIPEGRTTRAVRVELHHRLEIDAEKLS